MKVIQYIGFRDGIHYYSTIFNDKINVYEFDGPASLLKRNLTKMKASALIALYEDFISFESVIIDRGKDNHLYGEKKNKVKKFIEWASTNSDMLPEAISDNSLRMIVYLDHMINMISPLHSSRKELLFVMNTIKETTELNFNEIEQLK